MKNLAVINCVLVTKFHFKYLFLEIFIIFSQCMYSTFISIISFQVNAFCCEISSIQICVTIYLAFSFIQNLVLLSYFIKVYQTSSFLKYASIIDCYLIIISFNNNCILHNNGDQGCEICVEDWVLDRTLKKRGRNLEKPWIFPPME